VKINDLNTEIQDLEASNTKQKKISNKFNKELSEARVKFKNEKAEISKEYRAEIKAWRKNLGEETRQKHKLDKKLWEIVSTLAHPVPDFTPVSIESSTSPANSQPSIDTAENSE
jgi:predicted RNase H-like nuclease (RuvC/YqgF family)